MKASLKTFLDHIEEIYKEQPGYLLGHDGSDGKCDCIGMIKGALRRSGVPPEGLSGTNHVARYVKINIKPLVTENQLSLGDVVLKSKVPGENGYNLPDGYKKGGAKYNGDLKDYTHIGTVTSVNPLVITHMTSPSAKKDHKINGWSHFGQLPMVDYENRKEGESEVNVATVRSGNGKPVKMRAKPSTAEGLYWEIPDGANVDLIEWGDMWSNIRYGGHIGYMLSKFLIRGEVVPGEDEPGDPAEIVTDFVKVSRKALEEFYDTIGDWLGMRG